MRAGISVCSVCCCVFSAWNNTWHSVGIYRKCPEHTDSWTVSLHCHCHHPHPACSYPSPGCCHSPHRLISLCPVLLRLGSFSSQSELIKCNSEQVISQWKFFSGSHLTCNKTHSPYVACKTLPDLLTLSLILPLPSAIAALASLVLLGNVEPCSDLRAFALSVPAWGSALFYTLPSQANIASSERSSLTTSSLPSNSHFIFLAPWQVLQLIQTCFICVSVYYLLK